MGSYADYWLGNFNLGSTKNDVAQDVMLLFQPSDKIITTTKNRNIPSQLRNWADYYEEDEELDIIYYSAPLKNIKDRLELSGYTLDVAKKAYNISLNKEIDNYKEYASSPNGTILKKTLRVLEEINLENWLLTLKEIYENNLNSNEHLKDDGSILSYMLSNNFYGFVGEDINILIRLAIEVIPNEDEFIYDITDLVAGGWYGVDDDVVESSINLSTQEYYNNGKIMLLTEGVFDTWVLSESLKLLYPHLSNYYTFMDFGGSKFNGGVPNLIMMLKAFSGVGIINKVIAIFDNDSEAHAGLQRIKGVEIPQNIKYLTLPKIDILKNYPAIGPRAMSLN